MYYILTERHIHPQVLDVKTLNSADIGSDHPLLLGKIKIKFRPQKNLKLTTEVEKINIETLCDPTVKERYEKRVKDKIESTLIT